MTNDFSERMAELRTRFFDRAERDRLDLTAAVAAGRWEEARRLAHGLSGIAGTFGFHAVGAAGRDLERAIDGTGDEARQSKWTELDEQLAKLAAERLKP